MATKKKKAAPRAAAPRAAAPSPAEIGGALGAGALATLLKLVSDVMENVDRRHAERLEVDRKLLALRETEIAIQREMRDYAERMDGYYETFSRAALDWMDSKNAVKS